MSNAALLPILGYGWTFFGAYWMSFNVLKPGPDGVERSGRGWKFAFLALTFAALFAGRRVIPPALILILAIAWTAVGLSWGAPSKAAQSGEFKWYRLLRLFVLAGVFALLFWKATALGFLGKRFVPDNTSLGLVGFFAAIAGMFVTWWSRIVLGKYWSDKVIVQSEHQLVRIHAPEAGGGEGGEEGRLLGGRVRRGAGHAGGGDGAESDGPGVELGLGEPGVAAAAAAGAHVGGNREGGIDAVRHRGAIDLRRA